MRIDTSPRSRRRSVLFAAAVALLTSAGPASAAGPSPSDVAPRQEQDPTAQARRLLVELDSLYSTVIRLRERIATSQGEAQALAWVGTMELVDSLGDLKSSMLRQLTVIPPGPRADSIRVVFQDFLRREFDLVIEGIERRTLVVDSLRDIRASAPLEELEDLEIEIGAANSRLDQTLGFTLRSLTDADSAGIATGEQWARFDRFLLSRAAEQSGRLQLALTDRATRATRLEAARRSEASQDDLDGLEMRLRVAEQRSRRLADELESTADLLDTRRLPSASYRQLLIQATGEVTSDVLDPTVAVGLLRDWTSQFWGWLREAGPNLLVQLALLLGSILLSRAGFRVIWRLFRPSGEKASRMLTDLLQRMLMPVATIVGLGIGLTVIGIDATTLLAGLGVLGVIVGLALQDTLSNLASGLFILMYRPFDVDDIVRVGGVEGTVRAMGLASTTIVTFDGRRLFVPNRKVWGEVIENASTQGTRRIDVEVPITYEQDPDEAIRIVREVCSEYEVVLDEPEPLVFVRRFRESAVDLEVHAWADAKYWWTLRTQLPRLIRVRFQQEGIETPYPREVQYERPEPEEAPAARRGRPETG